MSDRRRAGERQRQRPRDRWVKRPPRPSRPPAMLARVRPGWTQAALGIGLGLVLAILAAVVTPGLTAQAGMPGLAAGLAFGAGFALVWRAAGGTVDDIRSLFR